MKFGVVIFPGSNCDHDMLYTLGEIMGQDVVELWHKDKDLKGVDAVMLPGGFSYGDYLRSGALARFSPIMEKVIEHSNLGGFVFGVCNGFQILCESGLLPGTLTYNTSHRFICKNIHVRVETSKTRFTALTKKEQVLKIPIAHGEGRYYADDETIKQLRLNNQILFRYCDDNGNITREANPNGSIENIAGICNEKRNVIGMMPHPERCSDDELGNTDGYILFKSLIES
jgi:phosphoribosylformylglycinamidine synthase subunit PurQ / glutaminase